MSLSIRASLLALAASSVGVVAHAQPRDLLLECVGPFARDADEAAIIRAFGADNVGRGDIDIGEATTEPGTVVFPQDVKRRIEVLWHDGQNQRRPRSIAISGSSTWAIATLFPDQRRFMLGAPLSQVEAINGRPFTVNGFGWANGGFTIDWKGGALGRKGTCNLELIFSPDAMAKPGTLRGASGGRQFLSSNAAMRAAKPTVLSIALTWPQ